MALLIGNGDYSNPEFVLGNPANDVAALDEALTRLGFEVRSQTNLSRPEMLDSLDWFQETANGAEIALVFYAGHAVQADGENFLIGTDLVSPTVPALIDESLTLSELHAVIEGVGADLSLVVLDACRNNPFGDVQIVQPGLAPASGSVGTLVAYATDPGNVAADGLGDNSIFTSALLQNIETPGIDVRIMFGRVRQEVVRDTAGRQVPWVEEAVIGEYYLSEPPDPLDPGDELRIWREAVNAGSVESYLDYLDRFPEGLYKIVAELRVDVLRGNVFQTAELASVELPDATAALQLIGYLVPGATDPADSEVLQAFTHWQSSQPVGVRNFEALMLDAASTATFLGTYSAGILKNDLQRYASVDEALRTARDNMEVAEIEFQDNPDAEPVLQSMRTEISEIELIHRGVAADLDASRTFYSDLILLVDRHLTDWLSDEAQPRFATSRGITHLSDRALSDAQMFYDHLRLARDAPEGSYSWLASMMQEN
ncbi:caspase family protein [Qingshengfaniella alkalisoli]|uniref:caspase family protein n=1 Tax=Qingshengfaniella alkalisoli TaxID=2599296 RepID=UPI00143D71C8|nr:caspase family protein [Qingshengfaniella alkalisoli]